MSENKFDVGIMEKKSVIFTVCEKNITLAMSQ